MMPAEPTDRWNLRFICTRDGARDLFMVNEAFEMFLNPADDVRLVMPQKLRELRFFETGDDPTEWAQQHGVTFVKHDATQTVYVIFEQCNTLEGLQERAPETFRSKMLVRYTPPRKLRRYLRAAGLVAAGVARAGIGVYGHRQLASSAPWVA